MSNDETINKHNPEPPPEKAADAPPAPPTLEPFVLNQGEEIFPVRMAPMELLQRSIDESEQQRLQIIARMEEYEKQLRHLQRMRDNIYGVLTLLRYEKDRRSRPTSSLILPPGIVN